MLRFKEARMALKLNQKEVADKLNVTTATYCRYEKGQISPDPKMLKKIAYVLGVSIDYLVGNEAESQVGSQFTKIPVLGTVRAGIPMEAVTDIQDYEEIPEAMARNGEYFALRISGDSMSPRICDGDVVIVRKQETVDDGQLAIVLVNGDEATVKEIRRSQFGLTLIGWNVTVYPPHFYPLDEVENLPVRIIGRVVELRGKF